VKYFRFVILIISLTSCSGERRATAPSSVVWSQSGYSAGTSQLKTTRMGKGELVWLTTRSKTEFSLWVSRRLPGETRLYWVGDVLWVENRDVGTQVFAVTATELVTQDPCKLKARPSDVYMNTTLDKYCPNGNMFDSSRPGNVLDDTLFTKLQ
jgi:hypothetical protein